jgi:hypothetical protein
MDRESETLLGMNTFDWNGQADINWDFRDVINVIEGDLKE